MHPVFLLLYFVLPIVVTFSLIKKYQLSKRRIAILFFLAPLIEVLSVESYILLTGDGESIGSAFFMGITILYIWLFIPLLTVSTFIVYIQKTYRPPLLKQLLIVSTISILVMGVYLYLIHQPIYPALFSPFVSMITVAILYYLTDILKVVK